MERPGRRLRDVNRWFPADTARLTHNSRHQRKELMRSIISIVVVVWLLIGLLAAFQRDYFSGDQNNCADFGNIAVTVLAGVLNYVGANPKVDCKVPQPSE